MDRGVLISLLKDYIDIADTLDNLSKVKAWRVSLLTDLSESRKEFELVYNLLYDSLPYFVDEQNDEWYRKQEKNEYKDILETLVKCIG